MEEKMVEKKRSGDRNRIMPTHRVRRRNSTPTKERRRKGGGVIYEAPGDLCNHSRTQSVKTHAVPEMCLIYVHSTTKGHNIYTPSISQIKESSRVMFCLVQFDRVLIYKKKIAVVPA